MLLPIAALLWQNQKPTLQSSGLHGYISVRVADPPKGFNYGVSLYSAAWPLLQKPLADFQMGLCATWIIPDNRGVKFPLVPHGTVARDTMPERGPSFWDVFQTIEGGLGFWGSNRYMEAVPKFRINGSVDGYNHELSSPGWDFYGKALPANEMGIAQLSNHVLIPPDGVTLAKNTLGQMFGYAYMALPLIPGTDKPVATGDQCWTCFFNTKNFKGPVAFWLPVAWSRMSRNYPPAVGRGLDALPGVADSGAIEVNTIPQFVSAPVDGTTYTRIPQLQFPADDKGQTVLMNNVTYYSKSALWNEVAKWNSGGPTPSSTFNQDGAFLPTMTAEPVSFDRGGGTKVTGVDQLVNTVSIDQHTFGLQWQPAALSPWLDGYQKGSFPSYFKLDGNNGSVVSADSVPASTLLQDAVFPGADESGKYRPSDNGQGVWMHPGPKAGPFQTKLADGSVVTYYWYRFIDQPSLQDAGLSRAEKIKLQALVVKMQKSWTTHREYMAPPSHGELASLDSAVLVKPPKGLEYGYVPIAIRQDPSH